MQENIRLGALRAARERFDALALETQDKLITNFGATLKGPALAAFKKTSLKSPLVSATFNQWLIDSVPE